MLRVDVVADIAVLRDGDASRLLRYDDDDRIGDLAHADGGAVAGSVGFGHGALRYGEDALCSHDAVALDHHGAVVQRGVLEEDVFEQRGGDLRVDGDAALGDQAQVAAQSDDDQCPDLCRSHFAAGRHDRHDVRLHGILARGEDAGDEVELLLPHADHLEESSQLGLEDDDQGDGADRNQLAEDGREQLHVQGPDDDPEQIYGDDSRKDVGGVGAFGHAVDPVHDRSHQDDVYEIDECERNETHVSGKISSFSFSCKCTKKNGSPVFLGKPSVFLTGCGISFSPFRPFCRRRRARLPSSARRA